MRNTREVWAANVENRGENETSAAHGAIWHVHTVEVGGSRPPSPTTKHLVRAGLARSPLAFHHHSVKHMEREVKGQCT